MNEPTFCLDSLEHVKPPPGPVWRDRVFIGQFTDPFLDNAEAEGGDEQKMGDIGALLEVFVFVFQKILSNKSLLSSYNQDSLFQSLQDVLSLFSNCASLSRMLAKIENTDEFNQFLVLWSQTLQIPVGTKILIPGGFRNIDSGHCMFNTLERFEDYFTLSVHNPGFGVKYHPSSPMSPPKIKYLTSFKIDKIDLDKIFDMGFWYMFFKIQIVKSEEHRAELLYDVLYPHLLTKPMTSITQNQSSDFKYFKTPQRSEINYFRSILESFKYLLRDYGFEPYQIKQTTFFFRYQLMCMLEEDLPKVNNVIFSDASLIRTSCSQLSRSSVKEYNNNNIDINIIKNIHEKISNIENMLSIKEQPISVIEQLQMDSHDIYSSFPLFSTFANNKSLEHLAGWRKDPLKNEIIDLNNIPNCNDITSFSHIIDTLKKTRNICCQLHKKEDSDAGTYFSVISFIQHIVINIIPFPSPIGHQEDCLWSKAEISYQQQVDTLQAIYDISRYYAASAKSLSSNNAFQGSQAVVMATLLSMTDAAIRINAIDEPSLVSLTLNGLSHLCDSKEEIERRQEAQQTLEKLLPVDYLINKDGEKFRIEQLKGKIIGLYFSASWCPACVDFTSILSQIYYENMSHPDQPFEIIWASMDKNLDDYELYLTSMPWIALPYSQNQLIKTLAARFNISSIPSLVLIDEEGKTITKEGTVKVMDGYPFGRQIKTNQMKEEEEIKEKDFINKKRQKIIDAMPKTKLLYYLSLKNGGGVEFKEFSEHLLLLEPELVIARSKILEYFEVQQSTGSKAIFNFPFRYNASTFLGKTSPDLTFVADLCRLLGYELNPNDEKSMDDQISYIEATAFYLTNDNNSPLLLNQKEFAIYRNMAALYKVMVADISHRRSIKLRRWSIDNAVFYWTVKDISRNKTEIDLNIQGFAERALCLEAKPIIHTSADVHHYIPPETKIFGSPTEDDILHCTSLPTFDDILNTEDSEQLLSLLTVPYLRLSLIVSFFTSKHRVSALLQKDLRDLLESVLFEPGRWISVFSSDFIQRIPELDQHNIGTPYGILLNELYHEPKILISSILQLVKLALELNTGSYQSSSSQIILFCIRILGRMNNFIHYALEHPPPTIYPNWYESLNRWKQDIQSFLLNHCSQVLQSWSQQAQINSPQISLGEQKNKEEEKEKDFNQILDEDLELFLEDEEEIHDSLKTTFAFDLSNWCIFAAHRALLYGGSQDLSLEDIGCFLSQLTTLRTWYSPGMGEQTSSNDLYNNDYADLTIPSFEMFSKNQKKGMKSITFSAPLMLFDQELFDVIQKLRRKICYWFKSADSSQRDIVLEQMVKVATRDDNFSASDWKIETFDNSDISSCVLFISSNQEIIIDIQKGELLFHKSHIMPVSNTIARNEDFAAIFKSEPQHCAQIASHEHRNWVRLVGRSYSIRYWYVPTKDINQLLDWPKACSIPPECEHWTGLPHMLSRTSYSWACFTCGQKNFSKTGCIKCGRDSPSFLYGVSWDDIEYRRIYTPSEMKNEEKWLFDTLEPVILSLYGKREKVPFEIYMPLNDISQLDLVTLLALDNKTWRFIVVLRERHVVHSYILLEHGRKIFTSLVYTSDSRFSFHSFEHDLREKAFPPYPSLRFSSGEFNTFNTKKASLVITRDDINQNFEHSYTPGRLLQGLIPSAFLEKFHFWQSDQDNIIRGYPFDPNDIFFQYKITIRLIENQNRVSAVITRTRITPEDQQQNAVVDKQSIVNMKTRLDQDDPLFQAIKKSKIQVLVDSGLTEGLAEHLLSSLNFDLPVVQSWLADPSNINELANLKHQFESKDNESESQSFPKIPSLIHYDSEYSESDMFAGVKSEGHRLLLLDILHAPANSVLYRLATVLSRIEDMSHILVWSTSSNIEKTTDKISISLVELPRLKLRFRVDYDKSNVFYENQANIRLFSMDHNDMFISDFRCKRIDELCDGIPHSLLLENNRHEFFLLVPNYPLHRTKIHRCPFTTDVIFERSNNNWLSTFKNTPRYFIYAVHPSFTFLRTPTFSSAIYLIMLRLLNRKYIEAFSIVHACQADMPLSKSETFLMMLLSKTNDDSHPNSHAIRLKISLATIHSGEECPWQIQEEYIKYLQKYNAVAVSCRLSPDEEIYLLKYLRSYAEIQYSKNADELNYNQQFLEVPLNNRLAYLISSKTEQDNDNSLAFQEKKKKQDEYKEGYTYLQNILQHGESTSWHNVHVSAQKFYSNFTVANSAWHTKLTYARPKNNLLSGSKCIQILNDMWKDSITGIVRRYGLLMLYEMFSGQLRLSITDTNINNSKTLAKLFSRIYYLKNTNYGARTDLEMYKSYQEASLLPYIILSLIENMNEKQLQQLPHIPYEDYDTYFNEGINISPHAKEEKEPMIMTNIILQILEQCQLVLFDPERLKGAIEAPFYPNDIFQIQVPHISSFSPLPEISNFSCSSRDLNPLVLPDGKILLSENDVDDFSSQPLKSIGFDNFIIFKKTNQPVSDQLTFNVSSHPDAQSMVAKQMIDRLETDTKHFASIVNSELNPRIIGMDDDDLNRITFLEEQEDDALMMAENEELNFSLIERLKKLLISLTKLQEKDIEQIPFLLAYILEKSNDVALSNESPERFCFLLQRYCGQQTLISLDYLTACLMSDNPIQELLNINPFIPYEHHKYILSGIESFIFHINRIGHVNRCISSTISLIQRLNEIFLHPPTSNEDKLIIHKKLLHESVSLATQLSLTRHSIGLTCGFSSKLKYDPRFVIFEYLFDILLRNKQVVLLNTFLKATKEGKSMVQQMIMGAGKTTVIGPLLCLILADGQHLVTQVVPRSLLEFSRGVIRSCFTRVIPKHIHTFHFDRTVKTVASVTQNLQKLLLARDNKGIVVTTPESLKSLMLKYIELLQQIVSAPSHISEEMHKRLKIKSIIASQLAQIINIWHNGNLLLDEVDLILHPLKSELNFPIGPKKPLELSPERWELPIHLFDAIFFVENRQMSVNLHESTIAHEILNQLKDVIQEGVNLKYLQSSPHLVVLNESFYHKSIKPLLTQWVILWLRMNHFNPPNVTEQQLFEYIIYSRNANPEIFQNSLSCKQRQMLYLTCDWLHSLAPHVLSKINRVTFGLLTKQDILMSDENTHHSRRLVAVPFVGKDVPSHASEFAHPDVLIGLTVLSYRYEGLRMTDLRRIISHLQNDLKNETGPVQLRKASILFDNWIEKGINRYRLNHDNDLGTVVPLAIFQLSDEHLMNTIFTYFKKLPDVVHFYLEKIVFPEVMQHQVQKISASGQELGGSLLFEKRLGFSGTPSSLLPLEMGACGYEQSSEGRIMHCMTDPKVISYSVYDNWTVESLLKDVANHDPPFHSLIDTGALITGMSNKDVAQFLLDHGLPTMEGVVFLDKKDRQMILLRSGKILPLAQCGKSISHRFTFYDQVHTTGMDIPHPACCTAALTLGKDMTFRDYSQGAYRMRGIGKGQNIHLLIIPEVMRLISEISKLTPSSTFQADVSAWLIINSMKSEKLQYMQLCTQSMKNIWRKRAFANVFDDTLHNNHVDQLVNTIDPNHSLSSYSLPDNKQKIIKVLKNSLDVFLEPVEFSLHSELNENKSFQQILDIQVQENQQLINDAYSLKTVKIVQEMARGCDSYVVELDDRSLTAEMVQEQEQEQEKRKRVEKEEEAQVRFSREEENQISWPVKCLSSFPYQTSPQLYLQTTLSQRHAFYPFDFFSIHGLMGKVTCSDIKMPNYLLLSNNYYRPEWADMGQRRLKNIIIVLEWHLPKESNQELNQLFFIDTSLLKKVFQLCDFYNSQTIDISELIWLLNLMGIQDEELMKIKEKDSHKSYNFETFLQYIQKSRDYFENNHRYFVVISLAEAESIRRFIHNEHHINDSTSIPLSNIGLCLRTIDGDILDHSKNYIPGSPTQLSSALQCCRYFNCESFFSDNQIFLLVRCLRENSPILRKAFFENVHRCRKRELSQHQNIILDKVFSLPNEYSLLIHCCVVRRIYKEILNKGMLLFDAFYVFDALSDNALNKTELSYSMKFLNIDQLVTDEDIAFLIQYGDKHKSGLLDYSDFYDLFRSQDLNEIKNQMNIEITPSSTSLKLYPRLVLPPEYLEKHHKEEEERLKYLQFLEEKTLMETKRIEEEKEKIRKQKEIDSENWRLEMKRRKEDKQMKEILAETEFWQCEMCSLLNESSRTTCSLCENPKPKKFKSPETSLEDDVDIDDDTPFWNCSNCTYKNDKSSSFCEMCNSKRISKIKTINLLLWNCPICTRLNPNDNPFCDVCNNPKPLITQ